MTIASNLQHIRERIAAAAKKCGRDPASVKLIAVSKTKTVSDILEAVKAGHTAFGENYAQELRDKAKEIARAPSPPSTRGRELEGGGKITTLSPRHTAGGQAPSPIKGEGDIVTPDCHVEWHFIGHLQKNKIKYVLPAASWIHTIDSTELLKEIQNKLANLSTCKPVNCLIEVNLAGESTKSGLSPEKLFSFLDEITKIRKYENTKIRGLMCIPPLSANPEAGRPYFKSLKSLLDEINSRNIYPEKLTELSMGMTQDFEAAIEEGATMVRIGTAIFGGR